MHLISICRAASKANFPLNSYVRTVKLGRVLQTQIHCLFETFYFYCVAFCTSWFGPQWFCEVTSDRRDGTLLSCRSPFSTPFSPVEPCRMETGLFSEVLFDRFWSSPALWHITSLKPESWASITVFFFFSFAHIFLFPLSFFLSAFTSDHKKGILCPQKVTHRVYGWIHFSVHMKCCNRKLIIGKWN